MNLQQIQQALARRFGDRHRIVFWNDPNEEFTSILADLELDGVEVVNLAEFGALEVKIRIEREHPEKRFLIYSAGEEPGFAHDWLYDIRQFSGSFSADRASILLNELGLKRQQLRDHLKMRHKFFDNKERLRKLKALVSAEDDAMDLDLKMLAVTVKTDQADFLHILRTLYHSLLHREGFDLDSVPAAWEKIEKYHLDASFWNLVSDTLGYRDEDPSLRNLLIRLLVSDFLHLGDGKSFKSLRHLQLPRSGAQNAVVCLARWRDSNRMVESYNQLSALVASLLGLKGLLQGAEAEDLLEVMTFEEVELAIVRSLMERVSSLEGAVDAKMVRRIASHRQAGHWCSSISGPTARSQARQSVYEALAVAAELFELRHHYSRGFDFPDASALYHAYESELFRFDQLHRHFCWHADRTEAEGWDTLKSLREKVEALYRNGFLNQLGLAWGKFVENQLLEHWKLPNIPRQFEFFSKKVDRRLRGSERRRVFVIVSDALRYEIAEELTRRLNGTYRFKAELGSQLGVLPSYTALGMAGLLPHQRLEYNSKGEVLVDGQRTSTLEQRSAILGKVGGLALRAGDLLALKKEEGRERVSGHRVVYIYHDEIDAIGDKAATEGRTFAAAHQAIDELANLVRYVINNLSGAHVLVTADHGFLFTETPPDETHKSRLGNKPPGTVKAKKRYLLGHGLPSHPSVWRGRTAETAGAEGEMEFWVPKGANRFHFTGGARFVHGGAMPQEIVVPVITVKEVKSKQAREKTKVRPVSVQVLGGPHKITAPRHRFKLIQTEAVSDRTTALTLKIAVYEGDAPVTSIETVTFESASDSLAEREKSVILTLGDRQFDKQTTYRLVLRDSDDIQRGSVPVIIDRAITDDFDF